jgi:hypothetical protein
VRNTYIVWLSLHFQEERINRRGHELIDAPPVTVFEWARSPENNGLMASRERRQTAVKIEFWRMSDLSKPKSLLSSIQTTLDRTVWSVRSRVFLVERHGRLSGVFPEKNGCGFRGKLCTVLDQKSGNMTFSHNVDPTQEIRSVISTDIREKGKQIKHRKGQSIQQLRSRRVSTKMCETTVVWSCCKWISTRSSFLQCPWFWDLKKFVGERVCLGDQIWGSHHFGSDDFSPTFRHVSFLSGNSRIRPYFVGSLLGKADSLCDEGDLTREKRGNRGHLQNLTKGSWNADSLSVKTKNKL